jgi:hypothetical protein
LAVDRFDTDQRGKISYERAGTGVFSIRRARAQS